jgi:hypothetical protein
VIDAGMRVWRAVGVVGTAILLVAAVSSATTPRRGRRDESAAVPVRYPEGTVHGFLELRTGAGALLAHGDLVQVVKDGAIDSHMLFRLPTSTFEETVTFTQRGVFSMQHYHLVQSGTAFADDLDVTLEGSGAYVIKTVSHHDGKAKTLTGTLELPADIANGMVITVAKNLPPGAGKTVHIVAFTPEPRIIALELAPSGAEHVLVGKHEETVSHIVLKPKLGVFLKFFAKLKGIAPPDSHVWIVTDLVPAFVRYQGPLFTGPVWRINLTSPTWPQ